MFSSIHRESSEHFSCDFRYKLLERSGKCHLQLGQATAAEQAFEEAKKALHISEQDNNKINSLLDSFEKQISKCQSQTSGIVASKGVALCSSLPKFSGNGKDGVLTLNNALTVGYSKESGRGVYANRDIDVGETLIIEKPYTSTVLSTLKNTYCHHCCSRVIAPVPCLSCSGVLFCWDQCRTEAWKSYHMYECDVLHKVWKADIGLGHLALKMVLKAGFEKLGSFSETEDDKEVKQIDLNAGYDTEDYESVHLLVNHATDRTVESLLKYSLQAYFLMKCVKQTRFLGDEKGIAEQQQLSVGAHLMRNLMMLPCNAHECSELLYKEDNLPESVTVEVGSAIYPFLSLINHSCDPNVVRHSYKNICVVRAIRNISKGTELLDNYGALCALTPTTERRQKLELQYFFTCHCEACTDDFPQYLDLPTDTPVFKCDKCAGPVFLPLKGGYGCVPCSFCQHMHDITPRIGSLGQSDEVYRMAMMDVLTGSCKNLDENIATLEGHLQLMDKVLCRPWRDYNDCQEALKQCYACKANHFPAKFA